MEFAKELIGMKYGWWTEKSIIGDNEPMWIGINKITNIDKNKTICCTGLINIIRRNLNLEIAGMKTNSNYPGSTFEWYNYFKEKNTLKIFDIETNYPKNTLLLRNYKNTNDPGHVAIIYEKHLYNHKLDKLLHSCPDLGVNIKLTIQDSHFYIKDGYYEYVVYPEDWLK